MICFSDSTEHGPAITTIRRRDFRSVYFYFCFSRAEFLLTNLYGAEIRTTFSTCGMASTDSKHAVTSPTPTTPSHALFPFDGVHFVPEVLHLLSHFVKFFPCGVQHHGNNHGSIPSLPFFFLQDIS